MYHPPLTDSHGRHSLSWPDLGLKATGEIEMSERVKPGKAWWSTQSTWIFIQTWVRPSSFSYKRRQSSPTPPSLPTHRSPWHLRVHPCRPVSVAFRHHFLQTAAAGWQRPWSTHEWNKRRRIRLRRRTRAKASSASLHADAPALTIQNSLQNTDGGLMPCRFNHKVIV